MRVMDELEDNYGESKDAGTPVGDHDTSYRFPHLSAAWHYPFTDWQFARLLRFRGLFQDGKVRGDTWPEPLKDEVSS